MNTHEGLMRWLGMLLAAIFAALALLHLYWAAGGQWGGSVAIPTLPNAVGGGRRAINPSLFATVLVAVALTLAMLTILGQLGWWGAAIPPWVFRWATRGLAVIFLLRAVGEFRLVGFFKQVRDTPFAYWDTRLYSPLCVAVALLAFLLTYPRRD